MDYHLRYFLILFFILIGIALACLIPLAIVMIMHFAKKGGYKATGCAAQVVSAFTSLAIIAFTLALLVLSMFSYIPWWASGILITVFYILVACALRPWNPMERNTMLVVILVLLFIVLIVAWVGCWLAHDICFTSAPSSYSFYINRYNDGDSCAKTAPAPCHTYLTFNTNASTSVIVHFHSTTLYKNPRVYYGTATGVYTAYVNASSHKVDIDASRYIYYGFLRSLTPGATYFFVVGDGTNTTSSTFIDEKKFRTAPSSGDVSFITGGDMGVMPAATTLLKAAAQFEPLYIALGGDLAYENGIRACYPRWDTWLTNWEKNAVTPTGFTIPLISSPGNHEAGGWEQPMKNMRFYNRYFVFQDMNGKQAWELPLHHVHYISNQVLVSLDSYVVESPASQVEWLTSVLNSTAAGSFKMAMYHAPGYPSVRPFTNAESTGVRTHFVPVFEQYGLTVGLENHDHAFKRTKLLLGGAENPAGILYVGDGAMGVKARAVVDITGRDYLQTLIAKQFYIHVQPNNTASNVKFDAYDIDATVFDTFTMNYRN